MKKYGVFHGLYPARITRIVCLPWSREITTQSGSEVRLTATLEK